MIFAEAGSSVRAVWREAPSCAVGWRVDCVRVAEATQSGLAAVMVLDCGDNVLKMRFSKMKRSGGLPESRCCNTPERGDRWFRNAVAGGATLVVVTVSPQYLRSTESNNYLLSLQGARLRESHRAKRCFAHESNSKVGRYS